MLSMLAKQAHNLKFLVGDNSPAILTGVGVVGTIATAYLTGRSTLKAAEIIGREQNALDLAAADANEESTELVLREKINLVWPQYLVPVGVGILTIGAIIFAHKMSASRLAAMTVAAGVSERALQQYKDKVFDQLGERQAEKIRDEIAQDTVNRTPHNEIVFAGTGQVICFDSLTGRYFQSTMEDVKKSENRLNYEILHYNSASLSFFFDELGLAPTDYTDSVGWNNHVEILYSTALTPQGQPCIVIQFSRNPVTDYDKIWS
jgi:Family of unknown function (DUF6353)